MTDRPTVFAHVRGVGLEGIVSKRTDVHKEGHRPKRRPAMFAVRRRRAPPWQFGDVRRGCGVASLRPFGKMIGSTNRADHGINPSSLSAPLETSAASPTRSRSASASKPDSASSRDEDGGARATNLHLARIT